MKFLWIQDNNLHIQPDTACSADVNIEKSNRHITTNPIKSNSTSNYIEGQSYNYIIDIDIIVPWVLWTILLLNKDTLLQDTSKPSGHF